MTTATTPAVPRREPDARIETAAATSVPGRAVVELLAHLTDGGQAVT